MQDQPIRINDKQTGELFILGVQVQAIRNGLRKEGDLKDVKVDTIHNVQGDKQSFIIYLVSLTAFYAEKHSGDEPQETV